MTDSHSSELPDAQFVVLFTEHERYLRAFVRSTGLDWNAVDEVMQTTSLVLWRKFGEFDLDTSFLAWGRVVARFEVLKYRRTKARDRHVLTEDLTELLADAAEEVSENSDRYLHGLQACLEDLPPKSRQLIHHAYFEDKTIREVAVEVGKSDTALYKTLNRIRLVLADCIEKRLATNEP